MKEQENRHMTFIPASKYMRKVNNRITKKRSKISSKLTVKTSKRSQWCHFGAFIVSFEHIWHLFLVFLLLTLNRWSHSHGNDKTKFIELCLFQRHAHMFWVLRYLYLKFHTPIGILVFSGWKFFSSFVKFLWLYI